MAGIAVSATLLAAGSFNLLCVGTLETKSAFSDSREAFERVYRIDLDGGIYCSDDCKSTAEIAQVRPTELLLESKDLDTSSRRSTSYLLIDRQTGALKGAATSQTRGDRNSILVLAWSGQCEKQPFTGFPDFETKF